jgi:hypothetical protein
MSINNYIDSSSFSLIDGIRSAISLLEESIEQENKIATGILNRADGKYLAINTNRLRLFIKNIIVSKVDSSDLKDELLKRLSEVTLSIIHSSILSSTVAPKINLSNFTL